MRFWRKKKQEDAAPEAAEAPQDDAFVEGDFDEAAAEAFFAEMCIRDRLGMVSVVIGVSHGSGNLDTGEMAHMIYIL